MREQSMGSGWRDRDWVLGIGIGYWGLGVRLLVPSLQSPSQEDLMAKYIVARREEIPPGGRKIVRVAGREVGVFNIEGAFYALKNVCPHQGARVCLGRIVGTALPSAVYEY